MAKPLLYIDLSKSFWRGATHPEKLMKAIPKAQGKITRKQAKAVHNPKDLPPGGRWVTIEGRHVYIYKHKIVAGSLPWVNEKGEVEARKASDEHLKELQEHYDKKRAKEEAKKEKTTESGKAEKKVEKEPKATENTKASEKPEDKAEAEINRLTDTNYVDQELENRLKEVKQELIKKKKAKIARTKRELKSASDNSRRRALEDRMKRLENNALDEVEQRLKRNHENRVEDILNDIIRIERDLKLHELDKTGAYRIPHDELKEKEKELKELQGDLKKVMTQMIDYAELPKDTKDKKGKKAKKDNSEQMNLFMFGLEDTGTKDKKGKTEAVKESATAKRLRETVKKRPLTVDEEQALHDYEKNEAVKKEILAESKKRRQEQLASVKKESEERKKKVQEQKAKQEAEEKQALAKRKEQEKEMNMKKVPPKGGEKTKAPAIKRKEIAPNTAEEHKKHQERANESFKEGHEAPKGKYSEMLNKLNHEWEHGEAAKLLSKAPNKRNAKDIERVAKELTEKFEPIAMQEAVKAAKRRGISLTPAKLYENNRQGKAITREHPEGKITEGSGLYGDIQQAARAAMYETFHSVLSGKQNPGTAIAPHVVTRIRTKVHRELYNLLNHMPAPHEIRPAIADLQRAENELAHKLGRTPTDEELAKHLEKTSEHFREKAPILDGEGKRIKDPVQRLKALRTYADQQAADSIDKNVGDEGEKEVSAAESLRDYSESPEEIAERKDKINRLRGEIPKALKELGMNDKELAVWMLKHSAEASGQNRTKRTDQEVADIVNREHKHLTGGKEISRQWVVKHYRNAAKKLSEALAAHQRGEEVPALKRLAALKSLMVQNMLRTAYLHDLLKSLYSMGIDPTTLEERVTRSVTGEDVHEIQKALAPYEAIGATALMDDGKVQAHIVELALPETNTLYRAFNDSLKEKALKLDVLA